MKQVIMDAYNRGVTVRIGVRNGSIWLEGVIPASKEAEDVKHSIYQDFKHGGSHTCIQRGWPVQFIAYV